MPTSAPLVGRIKPPCGSILLITTNIFYVNSLTPCWRKWVYLFVNIVKNVSFVGNVTLKNILKVSMMTNIPLQILNLPPNLFSIKCRFLIQSLGRWTHVATLKLFNWSSIILTNSALLHRVQIGRQNCGVILQPCGSNSGSKQTSTRLNIQQQHPIQSQSLLDTVHTFQTVGVGSEE